MARSVRKDKHARTNVRRDGYRAMVRRREFETGVLARDEKGRDERDAA